MSNDVTAEVVDARRSVYGEPAISFPLVAQVWSGILGTEVRPDQVPLLLIGYKLVRASECPEYSDNIDDVDGYAKIFREVMGDKLIDARSVAEFVAKKAEKESVDETVKLLAEVEESARIRHLRDLPKPTSVFTYHKLSPFHTASHSVDCANLYLQWKAADVKSPYICVCRPRAGEERG